MQKIAGYPPNQHGDADAFVAALMEALQIPEVRMEIIRLVNRAQSSSAPLARGQHKGR